jgi:hypothetical protein
MKDEAAIQRFAAYRIHQSLVEKPLTIERFWPLDNREPEKTTIVMEEGFWERLRTQNKHNIK